MPRFKTPDGVKLHYEDDGPKGAHPVLCLPGLTRNSRDFDYVAPHLLALGLRIIRLDARGRGQSDHAPAATYNVPQEAADVVALLDHLGLPAAAILGTSRGGLVAMVMAARVRNRVSGVAFNDIGPVIEKAGMEAIREHIGLPPAARTYAEAAQMRARLWTAFENVPTDRWLDEVQHQYIETADGLALRYDPALRIGLLAALDAPPSDLWPLFDLLAGAPMCLIRGANSDLLSAETAAEMARRRPDMMFADVPGRGHVPFLDESSSLAALIRWAALLPQD